MLSLPLCSNYNWWNGMAIVWLDLAWRGCCSHLLSVSLSVRLAACHCWMATMEQLKTKKTQSRQPVFVDTANCCSLGAACLLNFFLGSLFGYFVFRCSVICSFFGCFVLFLDKNKYLILHTWEYLVFMDGL